MKFFPLKPHNDDEQQGSGDVATDIFHRTVMLEGLKKEFSKILLYSSKERKQWLKDNADFIEQILSNIRQESRMVFTNIKALREQAHITEYFVVVQQTLEMMDRILEDAKSNRQKLN